MLGTKCDRKGPVAPLFGFTIARVVLYIFRKMVGRLAQSGERHVRNVEVVGSIPMPSTIFKLRGNVNQRSLFFMVVGRAVVATGRGFDPHAVHHFPLLNRSVQLRSLLNTSFAMILLLIRKIFSLNPA